MMKYALIITIIAALAAFTLAYRINHRTENAAEITAAVTPTPAPEAAEKPRVPVLVELYTSEGCSSCPPADRALAFLNEYQPVSGAQIVALEMHVDYFDNQFYQDPFAAAVFTQRQKLYAERYKSDNIYTPQMVVDGAQQFLGSDTLQATNVIMEASKKKKGNVLLSFENDKLNVQVTELPKTSDATVFLAIAEDNLSTPVKGGENRGRNLSHTAVVRELKAIGTLNGDTRTFETQIDIQLKPEWKKNDLKAIVFVQENKSRYILGVEQFNMSKK